MTIPDAEGADLPEGDSDLLAKEVGEGKAHPAGCMNLVPRSIEGGFSSENSCYTSRLFSHGRRSVSVLAPPTAAGTA